MYNYLIRVVFFGMLSSLLAGHSVKGAGFVCSVSNDIRIEVTQAPPLSSHPTRILSMAIHRSGKLLLKRTTGGVELYREGKTFQFLVRGGQNTSFAVASVQLEFPGWRDFLHERESVEGKYLVREGTQWREERARCLGQSRSRRP